VRVLEGRERASGALTTTRSYGGNRPTSTPSERKLPLNGLNQSFEARGARRTAGGTISPLWAGRIG
jgi:hypothetical protein